MSANSNDCSFTLYTGGFAPVGGIESFSIDLMKALQALKADKSLAAWCEDRGRIEFFEKMGVKLIHSRWAKGCSYGIPDVLLAVRALRRLLVSRLVVFGKLPPPAAFSILVSAKNLGRRSKQKFVYITPYRPSEMWPSQMPKLYREELDCIIVQAQSFEEDLRERGFRGEVIVLPYIPPCVDQVVPLTRVGATEPIVVGFLGRLEPQKNVGYGLEIFQLVEQPIKIEIFGEGSQRKALERQALKSRHLVTFHGSIQRKETQSAIDSCHFLINPSASEGQCLVAFESLARGRPFAATPVGALPDLMSKGRFGVLFPTADTRVAADTIGKLIVQIREGSWDARVLAQEYCNEFNSEKIADRYRDIFKKLLVSV